MEAIGRFRHGRFPDLFLEATRDLETLQLTKAHENIHRVLAYSSSHGMFLFMVLGILDSASKGDPRLSKLRSLAEILHRAEFVVQEGCATFLSLNMCMAAYGREKAAALTNRLPMDYHEVAGMFSDCLRATAGNPTLGPYVLKNLEFLAYGIALAAMNSRICLEFDDPDQADPNRLREYMLIEGPDARLKRIRSHFSKQANVSDYVSYCVEVMNQIAGKDFPLFDQTFMRKYISEQPAEWEALHRRLDMQLRRDLVGWLGQSGVVRIDDSYECQFSDPNLWSPIQLIPRWESAFVVETGILKAYEPPIEASLERHSAIAHTINYSLRDDRRVLVPASRERLTQILQARATAKMVGRVCYLPVGKDLPALGIHGPNRLIVDFAFYEGRKVRNDTLRVDGLAALELGSLIPSECDVSYMMTQYNFRQMAVDMHCDDQDIPGLCDIFVFFNPVSWNVFAHIRSSRSQFSLYTVSPFVVSREEAHDVAVPGAIAIREMIGTGSRTYFCLADTILLGNLCDLLTREANVECAVEPTIDALNACVVEACHGVDSVLDRCANGIAVV